jgi:hypothetical protein
LSHFAAVRNHDTKDIWEQLQMSHMLEEPLGPGGIAGYARRLRSGETDKWHTVERYLDRIAKTKSITERHVHVR